MTDYFAGAVCVVADGDFGAAAMGRLVWPEGTVAITAQAGRHSLSLWRPLLAATGADLSEKRFSHAIASRICLSRLSVRGIRTVVVGMAHVPRIDWLAEFVNDLRGHGLDVYLVVDPVLGREWHAHNSVDDPLVSWTETPLAPRFHKSNAEDLGIDGNPPSGQAHDAFPNEVPNVDFPRFVDAVERSLVGPDRDHVLTAFRRGVEAGLRAPISGEKSVRVLLADTWRTCQTISEASVVTRGIQAGLFERGAFLRLDFHALDDFVSGGYARGVEQEDFRLLESIVEPWKAAVAAMYMSGISIPMMSQVVEERDIAAVTESGRVYVETLFRYMDADPTSDSIPTDLKRVRSALKALPPMGIPIDVSHSALRAGQPPLPNSPGWHPRLRIRVHSVAVA